MNTHTIVSDIRRDMLKSQEGTDGQHQLVSDTCTLFIAELTLTVTQAQTRSVILSVPEPRSYIHT
jgi:hypothetical protein